MDAVCAKYTECKVTEEGTLITADVCAASRSAQISDCVQNEGASIAAASDADVDACVAGLAGTACTNICNQIPEDPPACSKVSSKPNTSMVTCAP